MVTSFITKPIMYLFIGNYNAALPIIVAIRGTSKEKTLSGVKL